MTVAITFSFWHYWQYCARRSTLPQVKYITCAFGAILYTAVSLSCVTLTSAWTACYCYSHLYICACLLEHQIFLEPPVHTFNFGQLVIACSFQYKSLLTYFLFLSHKQQFGLYKDQHHILISISLLKKLYASY